MGFIAEQGSKEWDFIHGMAHLKMSIIQDRFYYLQEMNDSCGEVLKISLKDPAEKDKWTKWVGFPGKLFKSEFSWGRVQSCGLEPAIDVHRSVLPNEIVIESDYPTYEENYDASRIVGAILEHKGFIPHYYYSGSKSIHIHVFIDFDKLNNIDPLLGDSILSRFRGSSKRARDSFIEWLREKMISCWDTNAREFDRNLIRATHLIRAELSRNKLGYKTFLGYKYAELPPLPPICNETTRDYPELGKIILSSPNDVPGLMEEFYEAMKVKQTKAKLKRRDKQLSDFFDSKPKTLRDCVGAFLSEDFKKVGDGHSRAMFILVNELRQVYGDTVAKAVILDWNVRMGEKVKEAEIDYRFQRKAYNLSCEYIHKFVEELGLPLTGKCKDKLYKDD